MMNIQELATVMHHKLNIKIFIFDNKGYSTIKQTQELGFDGRLMGVNSDTGSSFPDWWFVRAAHCQGGAFTIKGGIVIKSNENLLDQIIQAVFYDGPTLIPVMLNPDQPQAPRSLKRRNPDGTMNPTKLENSYPFLPPEVIEREMQ